MFQLLQNFITTVSNVSKISSDLGNSLVGCSMSNSKWNF